MLSISVLAAAALAAFILAVPAAAQAPDPFAWLVQSRVDGGMQAYGDPMFIRRHDWGPGPFPISGDAPSPLGYQASDNTLLWAGATVQTWSYGDNPISFNPTTDGGQIAVVGGSRALFWATQDTSYRGLQYLVGPTCVPGGGWLLFDTSQLEVSTTSWVTAVPQLAISKVSPTDCPPLAPAYTRYQRGPVWFPFQSAGTPSSQLQLDTILTEHYDHETIADSVNMERNWFAKGVGNVRWEAWSTTNPPGDDLAARCPLVTINGYYYPEVNGWHLTNCRYWTNVVLAPPGFSLNSYGWPYIH